MAPALVQASLEQVSSFYINLNMDIVSEAMEVPEDLSMPCVEDSEDFNIPRPERIELLRRLQEKMGGAPKYFWAACQICDLKCLEKLVDLASQYPNAAYAVAENTHKLILHWTQSSAGSSHNTTPSKQSTLGSSSTGSPVAKRLRLTNSSIDLRQNQRMTNLAKERDGGRCVLTGKFLVEVAHIYPFCRLKSSEEDIFGVRHCYWRNLSNFWPEEKVAAWEAEVFSNGLSQPGDERLENLITLSLEAHALWNRGGFALKPLSLSDDKSTLKLQFFWQKKQKDVEGTRSLLTEPHPTENLDRNEGAVSDISQDSLAKNITGPSIKSGQIFELNTDDPVSKPLPSLKLLELQWFLTRVVGMAGAAGPYEPNWVDDSDGDVPGLELDEGGYLSDRESLKTPEILRRAGILLTEYSKHHMEEAAGNGDSAGAITSHGSNVESEGF